VHNRETEGDRASVLARLSDALVTIVRSAPAPALQPAGGIELAYALPRAELPADIAAVVFVPGCTGIPTFGGTNEAVRCLLTARRFEARIRATGVIRNSREAEKILEELLLQVCSYDRSREPPGITVMHWGVAGCCREGVPDAVYDPGGRGAEGLIRLFAEDPAEIAQRITAIIRRLPGNTGDGTL